MSDNLLDEIIRDLTSETTSLSAILHKALVLASRIDDSSLSSWVQNELNGYYDLEQLPDYRIIWGEVKIDYDYIDSLHGRVQMTDQTHDVPSEARKMRIISGVGNLQNILDSGSQSFDQEFLNEYLQNLIIANLARQGAMVNKVVRSAPIGGISHILNNTRTRLLNFILEIQRIGIDTGKPLSQAKQEQVVNLVNQTIFKNNSGDIIMGDTYNNHGQVGAMGKDAYAEGNTFNQIQQLDAIDTQQLVDELALLREALETKISEPANYIEFGNVTEAEQEAKSGNKKLAVEILKKTGQWTLDTATSIGTKVVAEVIKGEMGL